MQQKKRFFRNESGTFIQSPPKVKRVKLNLNDPGNNNAIDFAENKNAEEGATPTTNTIIHQPKSTNHNTKHRQTTITTYIIPKTSVSTKFFTLPKDGVDFYIRDSILDASRLKKFDLDKDYMRAIGKHLKTNFSIKQPNNKRKGTSSRLRHTRSSSTSSSTTILSHMVGNNSNDLSVVGSNVAPDASSPKHIINLSSYHRCYVEDYMSLNVGETILVLLPNNCKLDRELKEYENHCSCIQFDKKATYNIYTCLIKSAPHNHRVVQSMTYADLSHGFGRGNYGCYIALAGTGYSFLLTWYEVLQGRNNGTQVWRQGLSNPYRDMYKVFHNRNKSEDGLRRTFNFLHHEMYGDRTQLSHLLTNFYRARAKFHSLSHKKAKEEAALFKPTVVLHGAEFNALIVFIDRKFQVAIESSYHNFNPIMKPLLSNNDVDEILQQYETKMPAHMQLMQTMLKFDKKEGETRNYHLKLTNFYKRRLLHQFMSQARLVNNHNLIHFAIISAAAFYGRGINSAPMQHSTHAGTSSSMDTLMKKITPLSKNAIQDITNTLKSHDMFVATLDNNQKGNCKKFQRNGSSNKFVTVTGRCFRLCNQFEHYACPTVLQLQCNKAQRVPLTYLDQKIPSMFYLPPYECVEDTLENNTMLLLNPMSSNLGHIDFSGERVNRYVDLVQICNDSKHLVNQFLTNFVLKKNKYKKWQCSPPEFCNQFRQKLARQLALSKSSVLREATQFQQRILSLLDDKRDEISSILVPPVSTRDEVSTSGFGMAIIELLVLIGVLVEEKNEHDGTVSWTLGEKASTKLFLYLCIDGLSLDRHRSFKKRLKMIPQSYARNFQQALVFQKALKRVIEIPGALHISFHMLQTIFDVFGVFIKWNVNVLKWKKIKVSKVSECFQLARELAFLVLEECERYLIDTMFMVSISESEKKDLLEDSKKVPCLVSKLFERFLSRTSNSWSENNEARKMIVNFVRLCRQFRLFWDAVRCGDKMTQEKVLIDFIGIFNVTGKWKYFEICLNMIEKEYGEISFEELEQIRLNSYITYSKRGSGNGAHTYLALDEAQEILNYWTKLLPVSDDRESWTFHSSNLMFARQAINYETEQYTRSHVEYINADGSNLTPTSKTKSDACTKTAVPRAVNEKVRVYEFIVLLCHSDKFKGVQLNYNDGINVEKQLTAVFPTSMASGSVEAGEENNTDDHSLDNDDDNDGSNDNQEENEEDTRRSTSSINRLALIDIFEEARRQLIEKNILEIRRRRKMRLKRDEDFFHEVNDKVNRLSFSIRRDIDNAKIDNINSHGEDSSLSFRREYRSLL